MKIWNQTPIICLLLACPVAAKKQGITTHRTTTTTIQQFDCISSSTSNGVVSCSSAKKCHSTIVSGNETTGCVDSDSHACTVMKNFECRQNSVGNYICCCDEHKCNQQGYMNATCRQLGGCDPFATTDSKVDTSTTLSTTEHECSRGLAIGLGVALGLTLILLLLACILFAVMMRRRGKSSRVNLTKRSELAIGDQMQGEAIGNRGFIGTAYTAVIRSSHLPVVAKELYPKIVDQTDFDEKQWRKYREQMCNLRHDNLAHIYQIFWPQKPHHPSPLIVYEKVGQCRSVNSYLKDKVKENEPLRPAFRYGILAQAASAMDYLHSVGICNPYLGGRNLIVQELPNADDGEAILGIDHDKRKGGLPAVKLTDFVMAWVLTERLKCQFLDAKFPELPVRWMPPETLEKNLFDKQSDVWAFGILCWEVMNDGKRPFADMTNVEAAWEVLDGQSVDPDDMDSNTRMKQLVYYRCFSYIESTYRPEMGELKKTLIGFYMDKTDIPPLKLKKKPSGKSFGEVVSDDSLPLPTRESTSSERPPATQKSLARSSRMYFVDKDDLMDPNVRLEKLRGTVRSPGKHCTGDSMAIDCGESSTVAF